MNYRQLWARMTQDLGLYHLVKIFDGLKTKKLAKTQERLIENIKTLI